MAYSPWGHDSREVKRWGFTCSQWKLLMRRLRLHGVRLPKKWILDPNKNKNMLANIGLMKSYGMSVEDQHQALLHGAFLFTKEPEIVKKNEMTIMQDYKLSREKMNELISTTPAILDLSEAKVGAFMKKVQVLGYSKQDVRLMVAGHPVIMTYPTRLIRRVTQRYLEFGLKNSEIAALAASAHHMFDTAVDTKIEKLLRWFELFLGADMKRVLKHPDVFLSKIARLKESYWWLVDQGGFSKTEVRDAANKCPLILDQTYQHLRIKLSFAKDFMEKSLKDVVHFPHFVVWPFRRISLRVAYLDYKQKNFKHLELKVTFRSKDELFVKAANVGSLEEYQHFETWWMSLTDLEILNTLQQRDYAAYVPSGG
ncbi:hypothetical protein BSKO_11755 [Bryopsis sp. KO-2023]|nr:hypothetical protein BSKO_11755 [Bryopsis sp. KO-2023]